MEAILVGNPNSGKTTLFNSLTGLNQKVGNYPGITVDKREGFFIESSKKINVTDLPGIYSLYPGSADERIAIEALLESQQPNPPVLLCVIDIQTAQKNLLLLSQLIDFGLPVIGVFNYRLKSKKEEIDSWKKRLKEYYPVSWYAVNANTGEGCAQLKSAMSSAAKLDDYSKTEYARWINEALDTKKKDVGQRITKDLRERLESIDTLFKPKTDSPIDNSTSEDSRNRTSKLDSVLMHPLLGYLLFTVALLLIFQAVFSWAAYPMEWIDAGFGALSSFLESHLNDNFFTRGLTQGIIPGLAGVVIFVPQIAFLFLFIALFEESGYMTRIVYLMDRLVKPFGMSGRSVVPLISGYACAIPAIMATRTIKHPREKLITMLVIPFMTCSARIPVYTTLIALLVSPEAKWGVFNVQGLILLVMYFFGAFMSFFTALIANGVMKGKGRSLLLMELPNYKMPSIKNVSLTIYEKSKSFVFQAGKVILLVSLALYLMANVGFNDTYQKISNNDTEFTKQYNEQELAKLKLENSLIGNLGKAIEPAIKPLGYDWKIGISLITSFAAREVFVGTMSTIYALEDQGDDTRSIVEQMRRDTHPDGTPKYSIAVILSLLIFYALAMQCLGTVAVMFKETGGWKWPIIQLVLASGSAYIFALIVYQALV
ncbi:MAG: ferrous iron transport protein B [Salibacteraceae bacterium]